MLFTCYRRKKEYLPFTKKQTSEISDFTGTHSKPELEKTHDQPFQSHVTSPYSNHTLSSKQVMRSLKPIRFKLLT